MQLSSINNRISKTEELIFEDGPVLDLAAALFICTDDEVYYLSSGSNRNIISIWVHIIYNGI